MKIPLLAKIMFIATLVAFLLNGIIPKYRNDLRILMIVIFVVLTFTAEALRTSRIMRSCIARAACVVEAILSFCL